MMRRLATGAAFAACLVSFTGHASADSGWFGLLRELYEARTEAAIEAGQACVGETIIDDVDGFDDVLALYPVFYTEDASFADPLGEVQGRDAIIAKLQVAYQTIDADATGVTYTQNPGDGTVVGTYDFVGTFTGFPFSLPSATRLALVDVCDPDDTTRASECLSISERRRRADELCSVRLPGGHWPQWKVVAHRDYFDLSAFGPPPAP